MAVPFGTGKTDGKLAEPTNLEVGHSGRVHREVGGGDKGTSRVKFIYGQCDGRRPPEGKE